MKIAGAQLDIRFGDFDTNLQRMIEVLRHVGGLGVKLVIFPECSLSGYCCESLEEARTLAVPRKNEYFDQIAEECRQLDLHCVVGYLEADGEQVFNSLAVIGPPGLVARYRKTHLPRLGVDNFTTPGECGYELFELDGVRIGLLICYDSSFPEATRSLALLGADLVILPTNWPSGAIKTAEIIPPARAMENHIYFAAINRVGDERGFEFVGKSRICHPDGDNIAFADHQEEEVLIAEIDPALARQKRLVRVPGKHEINLIDDRRPDLYLELTKDRHLT